VGADSGVSPYGGPGTALVRIGVSTRTATTAQGPSHVTFVVDTSGSMDIRERLGLVQSSLALLVNNLEPEDTIAIVEYGSEARRVLPPTKVRDSDRIVAAIDKLRPSGSTNMEAGLELGYRQAEAAYDPDGVNAVVLASDGVANVGVTESSTLTDTITQASSKGIHLVTVGYGMGNYNDTLMEQLADHGDGFYSYVDDFTEAQRLFVDELTPTLTVVASDAKAQVSFDPEFVGSYRLIGYENRGLHNDDYTDDAVDAGELGAGHAVSALYEIKPANAAPAAGTVVGTAGIRWATTDGGKGKEVRADIAWPQAGQQSPSLRLAALVAATAEYLRGEATGEDADLEALRADARALAAADVSGAARSSSSWPTQRASIPRGWEADHRIRARARRDPEETQRHAATVRTTASVGSSIVGKASLRWCFRQDGLRGSPTGGRPRGGDRRWRHSGRTCCGMPRRPPAGPSRPRPRRSRPARCRVLRAGRCRSRSPSGTSRRRGRWWNG